MNIFSTFFNIAKKETVHRSGLTDLIKDMHSDSVAYRKERQSEESSALQDNFNREQFLKAYKNLQITTVISTSFLSFMIAYMFVSEDLLSLFSIAAFVVIGFFWHLSFVIRAYRARIVWDSWDKKSKPLTVTMSEVVEAILADPKTLLPFLCQLKMQKKLHYVNIDKKKGLKKGDSNAKKN